MSILMNQIVLNATRSNTPQPSIIYYYVAFSHNYGYAYIPLSNLLIDGSTPTVTDAGEYVNTTLDTSFDSNLISRVLSSTGYEFYQQGRSSGNRAMFNVGTTEPSTITWTNYVAYQYVRTYCELYAYDSGTGIWTKYNGSAAYNQNQVATYTAYVNNGTVS